MPLNDRYTKHLVVSDSATVNPSQMAENVILVNSAGQKISTKTDAELNSRYRADGLNVRNPTHLRRWVAASGDALFAGAKQPVITCMGDSITTGALAHNSDSGATTSPERVKYRERGWVGTLRALLTNRYGFGGEGFMFATPTAVTLQFQEERVTCASSAASVLNTGPLSSGRKIVSGESITWVTAEPCTALDIIYAGHPTAVAAFTYTIDGGAPVTATNPAVAEGIYVEAVTGLSDAVHTVVVSGPATKYADIGGCIAKRGTGIIVNRMAKGGATSSTLVAPTSGAQAIARMMSATFTASRTDLAIVMLRYNDCDGDTVPPTGTLSFQSNLQTLCDAAVAAGACVLLCPDPPGVYPGSPSYTEAEYAAVMQSISDATDHVAYCDLSSIFTTFAAGDALGLYQDDVVHPNSRGHGLMGQLFYDIAISAHRSA